MTQLFAALVSAALLFAPRPGPFVPEPGVRPADRPGDRRVEQLVERLRPYADRFASKDAEEFDLDTSTEMYHQLWLIAHNSQAEAKADPRTLADLRAIEAAARAAVTAAVRVRPHRSLALVAVVAARGNEVARALRRIVARHPLCLDDSAWGYRPVPGEGTK